MAFQPDAFQNDTNFAIAGFQVGGATPTPGGSTGGGGGSIRTQTLPQFSDDYLKRLERKRKKRKRNNDFIITL